MLFAMAVRARYTILYGTMFMVSGICLLAIVAAFGTRGTTHAVEFVPPTSINEELQRQLAQSDNLRTKQLLFGAYLGLGLMSMMSLVLGNALAGRVLRPLQKLTDATQRISADNLHKRLAVRGPADEVKALADTIDALLSRLEESFNGQRLFVADASHELRTPLATIRASLDVAMAKPGPVPAETALLADRVRTELDQMDRLLEGLLLLARAQVGAFDDRADVTLADLVNDALRTQDRDIRVYAQMDPDVTVRGNQVLLARMVANAIDNAFRHNVADGWIRLKLGGNGEFAAIELESSGPKLDPAQVARLGRPFQRLGVDRTGNAAGGTGLGLSIVAAIADAHGGSMHTYALAEGGLRLFIGLPVVPVAEPVPV
jgi:signal transduction histidine kinase